MFFFFLSRSELLAQLLEKQDTDSETVDVDVDVDVLFAKDLL